MMQSFVQAAFKEMFENVAIRELDSRSGARASFQWGGTIIALFLLLLNRMGQKSHMRSNILVLYLFTSFPTVLFKILRGQFGCWVALLAVGGNMFFPQTCPVARFILFVIAPDWLADGLRDSIAGGVLCLMIGVILVFLWIREMGAFRNCELSLNCFGSIIGIIFLFFFTVTYLVWET